MRPHETLHRALRGEVPPNIAVMRLCMDTSTPEEASRILGIALAGKDDHIARDLRRLAVDIPLSWRRLRDVAAQVPHDLPVTGDPLAHWAACFDRAADLSPEASVALYTLGRSGELAAATEELVAIMQAWRLVSAGTRALDIGCGIGRLETALAPHVARIDGLDVSARMIELAREACRDLPNVTVARTASLDLAFPDASFDLVLAIDVLPYVTRSGPGAIAHLFREIARVLAPGGHLLAMNYAYDGSLDDHRRAARERADENGLALLRNGTRDLARWDGLAFLFGKPEHRGD